MQKRCKLNIVQQLKTPRLKLLNKHGERLSNLNLCERCGACCAIWKVCFAATELETRKSGGVPIVFTLQVNETQLAMKGTEQIPKRCCALKGRVGNKVSCSIYPFRPTTCRNFKASWEMGISNHNCDRARAIYGLVPFGSLMPFGGM